MKQETACPKLCRSCKKRYYFFIFSGLSARDFSDSAQHRENRELSALRRFVSTGQSRGRAGFCRRRRYGEKRTVLSWCTERTRSFLRSLRHSIERTGSFRRFGGLFRRDKAEAGQVFAGDADTVRRGRFYHGVPRGQGAFCAHCGTASREQGAFGASEVCFDGIKLFRQTLIHPESRFPRLDE